MASSNNLFGLEQTEVENTSVFKEIHKEIGEYGTGQIDTDSIDGVFDFLDNLTNRLQDDFDKLIGEDNNKKRCADTHFCDVFKYKSRHDRQNQKNT